MLSILLSSTLLLTPSLALSIPTHLSPLINRSHLVARDPTAQLLTIMPSASSCSNAPFPSECALASVATGPLIASFAQYSVSTAPEQAALLSWLAFESGELKYNANHYPAPGRPGQGTRAMLMPNFVSQYASSIPALASQLPGKDAAGILALVQPDQYSFGSAAWFYSTQCSSAIKQGVMTGGRAGWEAFITQCVGTTVDQGTGAQSRVAYWERACQVLSVPTA